MSQCLPQDVLSLFGPFNGETRGATIHRDTGKIYRLQVNAVFRIAFEDDLLPFDLAESIVLDHNDLHVQTVFDERGDLAHEHR